MQNHPFRGELTLAEAPTIAALPSSIVCGTDFTGAAAQAVEVAGAIAKRVGEPLVLVHAVNDRSQQDLPGELRESLGLYARAQLHDEEERLRASEVELIEACRVGAPEVVLLEEAAAHHARLLVLAVTKRHALSRSMLAGVTERVAEAAQAPTMVVRDAGPLLRWVRGERRMRVLVGADFSAPSEAALRWVNWLQKTGPCEVVVTYLEPGLTPYPTGDFYPPSFMDELVVKAARMEERHFRQRVQRMLGTSHVRIRFEKGWGHSDVHLIQMATQERADLMVIGTHSRRGWQRFGHHSVSRGVLHYAPLNVVCVPVGVLADPGLFFREHQPTPNSSIP